MNILDMLYEKTGGRPYVLLVMPYKDAVTRADKLAAVANVIREVVQAESNLACIRADDLLVAGHDLRTKLRVMIERAALIIAEVTDHRANVYYEVGYADGLGKMPLLLVESGHDLPYDLKGLEVFEYDNNMDGSSAFRAKLTDHLRVRLKPNLPLLRQMLAPLRPHGSYIVASPKYPGPLSRIQGQVYDTRTFGDHLGILGVISAFGLLYGDAQGLELISAQHAPPDLVRRDINLYLIGSPKVNPAGRSILKRLCTRWSFAPARGWKGGEKGDWPVALYRMGKGGETELKGEQTEIGSKKKRSVIWTSDYGLIVRGPHPTRSDRLVVYMAGAHSLGSAAACLAATRASLIEIIREKLPPGTLEDKTSRFWVLVKGASRPPDYLLDENDVSIEEVGLE